MERDSFIRAFGGVEPIAQQELAPARAIELEIAMRSKLISISI
jgi:hypothetical protein